MFTLNTYKQGRVITQLSLKTKLPLIPSEYLIHHFFPIRHAYFYMSKTQPEHLCIMAVEHEYSYLRYVRNQTEKVCMTAIKTNWKALELVHNQTEDLCMFAIEQSPEAFRLVRNQTLPVCLKTVEKDGKMLEFVQPEFHTPTLVKTAISQSYYAFFYTKLRNAEIDLFTVKRKSLLITLIENPTEKMIRIASKRHTRKISVIQFREWILQDPESVIKQYRMDPITIAFVQNQTEKLCKIAISQTPEAIRYIREQTETLAWLALVKDHDTFKYIRTPTEAMCTYLVTRNYSGTSVHKIKQEDRSRGICLIALQTQRGFSDLNEQDQETYAEHALSIYPYPLPDMKNPKIEHVEFVHDRLHQECLHYVKDRRQMQYMIRKYGYSTLELRYEDYDDEESDDGEVGEN